MENKKSWRDVIEIHPAADRFPLMKDESPDEFNELVDDIRKNGLQTLVALWAAANGQPTLLLDGRNRLDAAEVAGVDLRIREEAGIVTVEMVGEFGPKRISQYAHGVDPDDYIISANIHRRHLKPEQKRDIIAEILKAQPEKSDRQVAKTVKVSPTFVGKVRAEKEATGDVSTVDTRTDTKGRKQPATKEKRGTPAEIQAKKQERERRQQRAEERQKAQKAKEALTRTVDAAVTSLTAKYTVADIRFWLDALNPDGCIFVHVHEVLARLDDFLEASGAGRFLDEDDQPDTTDSDKPNLAKTAEAETANG
jgi:hypothetical protein